MYYHKKKKSFVFTIIFFAVSAFIISSIGNYVSAYAQGDTAAEEFTATLSGKEVVPPVKTEGTGVATFEISSQNTANYQINVLNTGTITTVEIRNGPIGSNGDVLVTVFKDNNDNNNNDEELFDDDFPKLSQNFPKISDISSTIQKSSSFSFSGSFQATDLTGSLAGKTINDLVSEMQSGNTYVVVNTEEHPKGELRGQISQ